MYRKFAIIFALAGAFAGLLITQPWKSKEGPDPRLFDRLPDAEIIGKSSVLDLARSLAPTLYNFKVPLREFLTNEFILSQAKNFGVDIQSPTYFFADEKELQINNIGALLNVSDSSKLFTGISKLKQVLTIRDTIIDQQKIFVNAPNQLYITYDNDWLMIYHGEYFDSIYQHVKHAKKNDISVKWQAFLGKTINDSTNTIAQAFFPEMEAFGWKQADIILRNDTTNVWLETKMTYYDTLPFQIKPGGLSLENREFTNHLVNLNLDVSKLSRSPNDPLYKLLKKYAVKYHLPLQSFLDILNGNIVFRQGGLEEIKERVVVSELDEDFNITEVVRYNNKKIPGYSIYFDTKKSPNHFFQLMMNKGFITEDHSKYRFVFSPPMNLKKTDSTLLLHTSHYKPKLLPLKQNYILFTYEYYKYELLIKSTNVNEVFCDFFIPLDRLVRIHFKETV